MKPQDFSNELNRLMDPYWRKARIAARLIIKREDGKPWSVRDRRLASRLVDDPGVTNRLVQQAMNWHRAPNSYHDKLVDTESRPHSPFAKPATGNRRAITNRNCATR
ncbi:MAG TPA: hypothetical protein PKA41_02645 [Verrucomicrobiota bacterium]|nr:hypothetical protein [Verrucomicrobiota bacterium]